MRNAKLLADHILGCHLPVIAAVNGPAVGASGAVSPCHRTSCRSPTPPTWPTPTSPWCPVAGEGGVGTWPSMMSILQVKEYRFTGERIPAETAVQTGLANRVVPADKLMDEALLLARKLAAQPTQALQETKRSLNLHLQQASLRVLPYALSAETESFSSPEVAATVRKFAEKAGTPSRESWSPLQPAPIENAPIFDADQHMYETPDALTRHCLIPAPFRVE
jgi:enoyl-CoA hydratase/carnithine racemase